MQLYMSRKGTWLSFLILTRYDLTGIRKHEIWGHSILKMLSTVDVNPSIRMRSIMSIQVIFVYIFDCIISAVL